jgi:hypothetical protein
MLQDLRVARKSHDQRQNLRLGDFSRQGAKSAKFGPSPEGGFGPQGGYLFSLRPLRLCARYFESSVAARRAGFIAIWFDAGLNFRGKRKCLASPLLQLPQSYFMS